MYPYGVHVTTAAPRPAFEPCLNGLLVVAQKYRQPPSAIHPCLFQVVFLEAVFQKPDVVKCRIGFNDEGRGVHQPLLLSLSLLPRLPHDISVFLRRQPAAPMVHRPVEGRHKAQAPCQDRRDRNRTWAMPRLKVATPPQGMMVEEHRDWRTFLSTMRRNTP